MNRGRDVGLLLAGALAVGILCAPACNGTFEFDQQSIEAGSGPATDGGGDATEGGERPPTDRPPCTTDMACGGARCNVETGVCVGCLKDGDCRDASRRYCAEPLFYCVECRDDDHCGTRKRCDQTTHRCVDACAEGDELCPNGFSCNESKKLCAECKSNANCGGNPNGAACDPNIGRCVDCLSNAQCPVERPACDRRIGRCVECVTSVVCGTGRLCDPTALVCRDP